MWVQLRQCQQGYPKIVRQSGLEHARKLAPEKIVISGGFTYRYGFWDFRGCSRSLLVSKKKPPQLEDSSGLVAQSVELRPEKA